MNVKSFVDGLKNQYPQMLHPPPKALSDVMRIMTGLGYTDKQLDQLYDEVIQRSNYFPRMADISTIAGEVGIFPPKKHVSRNSPDVVWETFEKDGVKYARPMGHLYPETAEARKERLQKESISWEDGGGKYFMDAFLDAAKEQALKRANNAAPAHATVEQVPFTMIRAQIDAYQKMLFSDNQADYDDSEYSEIDSL